MHIVVNKKGTDYTDFTVALRYHNAKTVKSVPKR